MVWEQSIPSFPETPPWIHNSTPKPIPPSMMTQMRVLTKAEAGPEGLNRPFVVTTRPGHAQRLFDFYEGRSQAENYIKELKNQLRADRLSCHGFAANCF